MSGNNNENNTNKSYEGLYSELFERAESLHESNKRRIRRGLIGLIVLPVVLILIRRLTDSDKIVFLIIWIIAMFILCAYLITVEYFDSAIQGTIEDVTDQEAEFDGLLVTPDEIQGKVRDRLEEIKAARIAKAKEREREREAARQKAAEEAEKERERNGGEE